MDKLKRFRNSPFFRPGVVGVAVLLWAVFFVDHWGWTFIAGLILLGGLVVAAGLREKEYRKSARRKESEGD